MDDMTCDDLLPCNGVETCVDGVCMPGIAVLCDDGVGCTVDACDEDTAECFFIPQNSACDDGLYCNGGELCDATLDCQAGTAIACNDGVDCTDDTCDEDADACAYAPNDGACDNMMFCDGAETCDPIAGCQTDDAFTCSDLIACTMDTCDEANDECDHTPDDGLCDNSVLCDGDEVCTPGVGCEDGTPVVCAGDNFACTIEACDEATGMCETTLDNDVCGQGQFCTLGGCVVGDPCNNAAECQDGNACNGAEICAPSMPNGPDICQAGAPVNCNDNIACTADSCNPNNGMCSNVTQNGLCSDGNPCNGAETCVAGQGCQDGPDLSCNDGVGCTEDLCIAGFGCNNIATDELCGDGVFCNGVETCDLQQDCQPGTPVVCGDDGIACTTASCDEDVNACVQTPNDDVCPCGQECDPNFGGCTNNCSVAFCDGHVYACGDCVDNDNDCDVDDNDANCFGACSNNEEGLKGEIPGQNAAPCKHDCYFDGDSGAGNDDCYWSHECDPLEPSATTCEYDAGASIPGYPGGMDCTNALDSQSAECVGFCEDLAPNGCDCFGCCEVPTDGGGTVTVFLGSSVDGDGDGTCNVDVLDNPALCHPCTQVPACINPCDPCEICFGNEELPPECGGEQICEEGEAPCGQPGQAPCPEGAFCLTGCCQFF